VNPVLALGLLAAVGILATRLPGLPLRQSLPLDVVFAAGVPLVLLGVVLGPGIGVLDATVLRALAPVTALAVGWLGAVLGARFEWRYVKRISPRIWVLTGLDAVAVLVVVGLGAWVLAWLEPALSAAWTPRLPAMLALGAVAATSGPGAVALVAQALGVRRGVANAFGLAAALETAWGALALTLALAVHHPRGPAGGVALGWFSWLALALGSGALVGMLFLSLTRLRPDPEHVGIALLGTMLFGAGVGYAADISPFVVCGVAAALIVNATALRRRVRTLLAAWEHPIYAVLLVIAGAVLVLPTFWVLVAAPLLFGLRIAAKWAVVRYGRVPLALGALPPHLGLATVAQGGLAIALGISFFITYRAASGAGALLTTIVVSVGLAQLAAPPLMNLALRPTALTAPAPRPELTAKAPAD
jgi:hypothetical protein